MGGYIQEKWKDRGRERGKYKGKRGDTNILIKIRTLKKKVKEAIWCCGNQLVIKIQTGLPRDE